MNVIQIINQFDLWGSHLVQRSSSLLMDVVMLTATWLGNTSTLIVIAVMAAAVCFYLRRRHWAEALLLSILLMWGYNSLKLIFERARPLTAYASHIHSSSFPSGHAADSVAIYGLIGYLIWKHAPQPLRSFGIVLGIGLPLIIGVSRVYLGAHYPTDVLGGWVIAGVVLAVLIKILNISQRKIPDPERSP